MDRLAFESRGEGPPIVLLHGLATTRVIWRRVAPELARRRRVIAVDVPGFGESPPVGPGFELESVASRIVSGLERAGVTGPFDLVGHSMGGAVALTIAAASPAVVGRLVLVAPAGLRPLPLPSWSVRALGVVSEPLIALRRAAAPAADVAWVRRLVMSTGTVDGASIPPAEVRAMLDASRGATRVGAALATVAGADLRPLLSQVAQPLGVVWGSADRIIPSSGIETVLERRRDAQVATVDRAGHIAMMERPRAFARALDRVLSKLS